MEQGFIDILKKLIAEQGNDALTDARKCKALLADYVKGEYKKESRFIVQAVEAGAAKAIAGAGDLASCKKAQARELEEEYGLAPAVAADVVNTLAQVLRGDATKTEVETPPVPKTAPQPETPKPAPMPQAAPAGTQGNDAFMEGKKYLKNSEWDKAVESFTEAINLGCTDMYEAYLSRARAYSWKGQYTQTINDCTTAISLNPKNIFAYRIRGEAYHEIGMKNEAIRDLEKAICLDPKSFEAKIILAKERGDTAKAAPAMKSASKEGEKAYKKGKESWEVDKEIKWLTEAINLGCTYMADAYVSRGKAYLKYRQLDQAASDFATAISLGLDYAIDYYRWGEAHFKIGQYDQAISAYTMAIVLDPNGCNDDNYGLYCERGEAYHKIGMKNEAIRDLEKVISVLPNGLGVKETLRQVRGY